MLLHQNSIMWDLWQTGFFNFWISNLVSWFITRENSPVKILWRLQFHKWVMEKCILQGSLWKNENVCEKMLLSEVCLGVKWQDLHSIQKKIPLNHYKKVFVTRDRCVKMLLPKDSVSLLFAYFSGSEGWPYGRHWRKIFWN